MHFLLDPCKHFVRRPRVGFIAPLETAKGKTFMRKKNPLLETCQSESLREGFPYPCFAPRAGLLALFGRG